MPKTYAPIATTTVSGSSTNAVVFSSIPQTYTDLVVVAFSRSASASGSQNIYIFENSDFSTNRSSKFLIGNGTTAIPSGSLSAAAMQSGYIASNSDASNVFSTTIIQYLNYSNTGVNKTSISRSNSAGFVDTRVKLWPVNTAISELWISNDSNNNWVAGSTFTLYGIKAA